MRKPKRVKYRIGPRLKSGERRTCAGVDFPPMVLVALRAIARQEGRSVSWVIEEILIDWVRANPQLRTMLRGGDGLLYKPRSTPEPIVESDTVDRTIGTVLRRMKLAG